MTRRGFGIAAAIAPDFVEPLAIAAEEAGYSTFWTNDTPGADGLGVLARAAAVTQSIRLGVGVVPLDRRTPHDIASSIDAHKLPVARLVLGVGSGSAGRGSLELVRSGVRELKRLTECRIAVGALGPGMIALAGKESDAVLLNWLTPNWIASSASELRDSGRTEIAGYVRTALIEGEAVLRQEADRYASFPAYARHFERMGTPAIETCAFGDTGAIQESLRQFDAVLDETVVRAIVGSQTLDAYLSLLKAAAPA